MFPLNLKAIRVSRVFFLYPKTVRSCLNFLLICFLLLFPILVFWHFLTFSWLNPGKLLVCGDEQRPSHSTASCGRDSSCPWTMGPPHLNQATWGWEGSTVNPEQGTRQAERRVAFVAQVAWPEGLYSSKRGWPGNLSE